MRKKTIRFETKSIHSGEKPDHVTGAIVPPIYLTSTFYQNIPGQTKGYDYSRTGNPTRDVLENKLAALENGKYGLCFASGMAAINNVLSLLNAGDHVVSESCIYGGTYRLFTKLYPKYKIKFSFVDCSNQGNVISAIKKNTKLVWLETPTNPLLKLVNIEEISKIAHENQALVVVDNTFASPYLQQPLSLGSDIVVHSTTKYISGHTDIIGGAIITSNDEIYKQLAFFQNTIGAVPSPFDCWLLIRSSRTLPIRMKEHCKNAKKIANFLASQSKIKNLYYPGLSSHPQHELAKTQMKDYGGIISFELKGGFKDVRKFLMNLKIFSLAVSLGGVESLVEHPATMSHASIPSTERDNLSISDGLIRLSVGLENINDLIEDLQNGFNAI